MEENELIQSINDVFSTHRFVIPSYQRGYKWPASAVSQLLDDILAFSRSNSKEDAFYCVQNITIYEKEGKYIVIDGQQRLTTIYIILSYLQIESLTRIPLIYGIRESSNTFLQNMIRNRGIWETECNYEPIHKDEYYLKNAAICVKDWFEKKLSDEEAKDLFTSFLLNRVKMIVNDVVVDERLTEEKFFVNINGAKVPLDGSDLIRALLMTKATKERYSASGADSRIDSLRVKIGIELDEMSLWWGKEDVRIWAKQLLPNKLLNTEDTRFGGNVPINTLYKLFYLSETLDNNNVYPEFGYSFFENGVNHNERNDDDYWEMYKGIRSIHKVLNVWYYDTDLYHYIGYLFANFKSDNEVSFRKLYSEWTKSNTKKDFILKIKKLTSKVLLKSLVPQSEDDSSDDIKQTISALKERIVNINENWYDNSTSLFRILVLMDILTVSKPIKNGQRNYARPQRRIDVRYFDKFHEDKEHIGCQTPNESDRADKNKWIKAIRFAKEDGLIDKDKASYLLDKLNNTGEELDEEQQSIIVHEINALGLNSIGNMAMLDEGVNRGYGNASFVNKRLEILDNHLHGKYIRPYTLFVFMKGFESDDKNLGTWRIDDIKANANYIGNEITGWLSQINA